MQSYKQWLSHHHTALHCSVHKKTHKKHNQNKVLFEKCTINDKLVQCGIFREHSNQQLCPTITKFTDLTCSVHQELSRPKVAFIWAYMCSILRVHRTHSLCPTVPKFTDLKCSVHQEPSRQKVVSIWAYMWSILEYIVTISLSDRTQIYYPYMFSTPRTKTTKSGFQLSLYV